MSMPGRETEGTRSHERENTVLPVPGGRSHSASRLPRLRKGCRTGLSITDIVYPYYLYPADNGGSKSPQSPRTRNPCRRFSAAPTKGGIKETWRDPSWGRQESREFSEATGETLICHPLRNKAQLLCFLLNFPLCLQKGKKWALTSRRSHAQGLPWAVRWFSGQG